MSRPAPLRVSAETLILLACAGYLLSLLAHGRFHQDDFRAYRTAAGAFVSGSPLYFVTGPESPYLYRYAPPVALAFLPFRLLPVAGAALAWYTVNSLLVVALWRLLRRAGALRPAWAIVFFASVGVTLERELGVGNINLLSLVACLAAYELAERDRIGPGAAMMALTSLVKPANALAAIPFVRRWPRTISPGLVTLVVFAALPLPFYGWTGTRTLYSEYVRSLADFQHTFGETFKYHGTTAGLLERAATLVGLHGAQRPAFIALGVAAALAALAAAMLRRRGEALPFHVGLALVPLTITSDTNVFVFAAPLIAGLLLARQAARWPLLHEAWLAAGLVLFGGNWHDLWGRGLSVRFADLGLHGLGAWLLVALALARPAGAATPKPAVTPAPRPLHASGRVESASCD